MRLVARALRDTGTERTAQGQVLGIIPWSIVMDWCDRNEVHGDIARMVWEAVYSIESDRVRETLAEIKAKE